MKANNRYRFLSILLAIGVTGLLFAASGHAQKRMTKVNTVQLKTAGVSKLKMTDVGKVLTFSGSTMKPKKGYKILRAGNRIIVTNESVPTTYAESWASGKKPNADGTCTVEYKICACPQTLVQNSYGGNATDSCGFNAGNVSRAGCMGSESCCSFFESEIPVDC